MGPTPIGLKEGRGFLYDAKLSGNGTMSCATCHLDGGVDGLAWDLGDPGGRMAYVTGNGGGQVAVHPMKGPMTTQTLRGLPAGANLHWRGEKAGLASFNSAFQSLLGGAPLAEIMECVGPPELPGEGFHMSRIGSPYFRHMGLGEFITAPTPTDVAEAVVFILRRGWFRA